MKLLLTREALLRPLSTIVGVVERRAKVPILGNVLILADESGIEMVGSDNEVEVSFRSDHPVMVRGSTTVNARKLHDIVRALPEGLECQIEQDENHLLLRAGRSRFSLVTLPAADFPRVPEVEGGIRFELPARSLRRLIERSQFAMAQQDFRYYLNGLLVELAGARLRAVATDGHRLALTEQTLEQEVSSELQQFILPRKGVSEALRLLPDAADVASVIIAASHLALTVGHQRLVSRLVDARYPDYERVLPREARAVLEAPREALRQAFNRIAILSNEKYRGIRLNLADGLLKVSAQNPELEMAEEEMEVSYTGQPLEVGFNVSYLLEALAAMDVETVAIEFTDPNSSCLLRASEGSLDRYVVMPMRL
ncbi:MAG TPA: DNA polymerase III subunit beta [Gammaproteobacteria bacterium]|nr:DNA polymerase III subunit beta [Gammaproteobacteria bacterium]